MEAIICQNDVNSVIEKMQEYLKKEGIMKGLYIVDQNEQGVVILLDDEPVDERIAKVWWSGYKAALE